MICLAATGLKCIASVGIRTQQLMPTCQHSLQMLPGLPCMAQLLRMRAMQNISICLQAFGAKAFKEVGNWWQRAVLILWVACIPITALWTYASPILVAIGQEPQVADLAALYLR